MVVSILSLSLALQPHAHLRLFSSCAHCRTSTSLIVHLYAKLAPFLGGYPLSHSGSEAVRHMALFLYGVRAYALLSRHEIVVICSQIYGKVFELNRCPLSSVSTVTSLARE